MSHDLDELLLCQHFAKNLSVRACLRRQVERQESVKPGVEGPPVKAYCASGRCELGNRIRACHPEARACPVCGTGLVGVASCPTCAARAAEKAKEPPRVLPTPEKSTHIWAPGHVEPDFEPPNRTPSPGQQVAGVEGSTRAAGAKVPGTAPRLSGRRDSTGGGALYPPNVGRRGSGEGGPPASPAAANHRPVHAPTTASGEGRGAAGRAGIANPSPPPRPQPKEETMPRGIRATPCEKCGSKSSYCLCMRAAKAGKAAPPKSAPKASRPAPARAAARILRTGPRGDDDSFDLGAASVEDLIALITGCQEELRHRKAHAAEQLAAIEKAIGSAA